MEQCRNGHELTAENTRTFERKKGPRAGTTVRRCTDCQRGAQARYEQSGRAAARRSHRRQQVDRESPQPLCGCGNGKPTLPSTRNGPGSRGRCSECHRAIVLRWQKNNPEAHRAGTRRRKQSLIDGFIAAYGGRCECCGETGRRFLTLDHTNNDGGGRDRNRTPGMGTDPILRRLRSAGWPRDPAYALACFNCNAGRHLNGGICPHQEGPPA